MAKFVRLVNGRLRSFDESSSTLPTIYDEDLIVVSGTPGAGEVQTNGTDGNGDAILTSGTAVTLPNSGDYTGQELKIYLNGQVLDDVIDFNTSGAGPTYTAVTFTFDLYVDDVIRFHKERDE